MAEGKNEKHVISLLTNNTPGVLVRVGLVFAKRGFNIDSLVVSAVSNGLSRTTVVCSGDATALGHMIKSLNKLIDVISAYDHTGQEIVERELALFKVLAKTDRTELFQIMEVFRAKAVDVCDSSIMVEITGTTEKLDAFESLMKKFEIIEMVRSGKVLLARIALIASILLAISHTHINFSRIASVAYIHGTWLVPLELYFLLSGLEKRQAWRTALSGILVAIHFSVYLTAQVMIALVLVYMLLALIFYRAWFKTIYRVALAFWGGFLIAILPEAVYISRNTNEFLNRLAQNGTFQSGWLDITIQSTGQSAATILFGRVVHAFLSLIYYPAFDFYGSPAPMLTVVSSVLFLIGLAVSLLRARSREYLLLNGYFWGATLAVGLFAIPPSADSYRMLMAFPAALVMCAIGLDQILAVFGIGWQNSKQAYAFSISIVLLGLLILNAWTYFGDFAGQCRFGGNLAGRFASYLGSYVKTLESESSVYLLSDGQFFYGSHASTDFLSQHRPIINHSDPIDSLRAIHGETIIANPDRIKELEDWVRLHPGGKVHYVYDCQNTILMAYQIP